MVRADRWVGLVLVGVLSLAGCDDYTSKSHVTTGGSSPTPPPQDVAIAKPATAPAPTAAPPATQPAAAVSKGKTARSTPWVEPDKRPEINLDFQATNQDGQMLKLADLVGTPVAVSFFFTRCPNPEMCPLIASTMAMLQRGAAKAGLEEKLRFALVSYDPDFDTPPRMLQFGKDHGFDFSNGVMLRPDRDKYMAMLRELGVDIAPEPDGNIGHFIDLILIDKKGRFVRSYTGAVWDNETVLADLRKLAAETE
ncbi:MAG: SCO family protein [Planctomycetes bacterium]|nr:SCO family protein [Planctomycetota bacterium]